MDCIKRTIKFFPGYIMNGFELFGLIGIAGMVIYIAQCLCSGSTKCIPLSVGNYSLWKSQPYNLIVIMDRHMEEVSSRFTPVVGIEAVGLSQLWRLQA